MMPWKKKLELYFLASVPALLTGLLAVAYLAPKHMEGLQHVMPILPLMPVFYWNMLQRAVPYWFLFLLGLMMDAVTGLPLGLTSLLYLMFSGLVHTQRRYMQKEGFVMKWTSFSALAVMVIGLSWLCLSWFGGAPAPIFPALVQCALTAACYPLAHRVFDIANDYLHEQRWRVLHGR